MDGMQHCFLSFGLIQTATKDEVSTSLTSARSVCAVSGFVIRSVLCSPIPYRNQCVVRLMFRRQHVEQHKERLDWNNTHPCNRPQKHRYRATTVGLKVDTRFQSRSLQDIKMLVRGDDFVCLSDEDGLKHFDSLLKSKYTAKDMGTLGFEDSDVKSLLLLNLCIESWSWSDWTILGY